MRHLLRNFIIVLAAIVLFSWSLYPPSKTLRLGKDLAGGVSLVYAVNIPGGDKSGTMSQIIEVLKERLDPAGVLEISIVKQGTDRLEITMPLPTAHVKGLKEAFEAELRRLAEMSLTADEMDRLMALPAADRAAAIERVSAGNTDLAINLVEAADLYDAFRARETEYRAKEREITDTQDQIDVLIEQGADPMVLQGLRDALEIVTRESRAAAARVAAARDAYQQARGAVLSTSIEAIDVKRALNLSDRPLRLEDATTKQMETLPSPRQRALKALRDQISGDAMKAQFDAMMQKWGQYEKQRRTLDDVEDLKRLVQSSGVLNFRITIDPGESPDEDRLRRELKERGPRNAASDEARWFRINKIANELDTVQDMQALEAAPAAYLRGRGYVGEEYNGEYYVLAWDTRDKRLTEADGDWAVSRAFQTFDEVGRSAIGFNMDTRGGQLLKRLTEANTGERMAVLLDNEVYTAPTIQSAISTNGRITGDFSQEELNYIIRVLNAGSLQGSLSPEPISENTLAPTLGQDNLNQGIYAGLVALIAVSSFMILYYFFGGMVAVIGLLLNGLFLLGAMAMNRAAFTLPGIAGVILTFGMAVDANVLIYERIREELIAKADIRTAVRLGYQRALSSIVDGNVTNLIVCVVLGFVGTPEIKGFALTLGIGVVCTLFTALFVSRMIFSFIVDEMGVKSRWPGQMLALAIPVIDRALTPRIDWLRLRFVFLVFSVGLITLSGFVVVRQGSQMLGTEFRGGTEVTIRLKPDPAAEAPPGRPTPLLTMKRPDVEQMVKDIGRASVEAQILELTGQAPLAAGEARQDYLVRLRDAVSSASQGVRDRLSPEAAAWHREASQATARLPDLPPNPMRSLINAEVLAVNPLADGFTASNFKIRTTITDADALQAALTTKFQDVLDARPPLVFEGVETDDLDSVALPIEQRTLNQNQGLAAAPAEDVSEFLGGVVILLRDLRAAGTGEGGQIVYPTRENLEDRIAVVRSRDVYADTLTRRTRLIVLEGSSDAVRSAVLLAHDSRFGYFDDIDHARWKSEVQQVEWRIVKEALATTTTLASVQSFSPAIARTFVAQAVVAIMLSIVLIIIYVWVRFGSLRYSIAAILTTMHDVAITVGLIGLAEIIFDSLPGLAGTLKLQPFKIDLNLIAALLTILGYSINDTIIVMDRIRENRGKLPDASRDVINLSINQTISRTVITSGTTLLATVVLYVLGGEGVREFAYALLVGLAIGTYSSIAIAAPLVWSRKADKPAGGDPFADVGAVGGERPMS